MLKALTLITFCSLRVQLNNINVFSFINDDAKKNRAFLDLVGPIINLSFQLDEERVSGPTKRSSRQSLAQYE